MNWQETVIKGNPFNSNSESVAEHLCWEAYEQGKEVQAQATWEACQERRLDMRFATTEWRSKIGAVLFNLLFFAIVPPLLVFDMALWLVSLGHLNLWTRFHISDGLIRLKDKLALEKEGT